MWGICEIAGKKEVSWKNGRNVQIACLSAHIITHVDFIFRVISD